MTELEALGVALDRIYGLTNKPLCPICGLAVPQPHPHCDACESPHQVAKCGQGGCQSYFCEKCQREHSRSHA